MFTCLLKDMVQDMNQQPDEEMQRAGYVEKVQSCHDLSRQATLPVSYPEALWTLSFQMFMEAPLHRLINSLAIG